MGQEDVSATMGKALGHLERITEHVCFDHVLDRRRS